MPKHASRRDFLKRAGLLSLAVPGAAVALDACANVATSAKASTIRVGWTIEPDTMNPMTSYSTEAVEVLQLVYDYLIGTSLALKSEPGLATSWAYSADGKTITYRLRSATWHDGKPFTSADVKFTFELIKSKQLSQYAQWVTQLASVRHSGRSHRGAALHRSRRRSTPGWRCRSCPSTSGRACRPRTSRSSPTPTRSAPAPTSS